MYTFYERRAYFTSIDTVVWITSAEANVFIFPQKYPMMFLILLLVLQNSFCFY